MLKQIPKEWKKLIGNNYHIKECGGSGDCLFHVFATALNDKMKIYDNVYTKVNVYDAKTVRNDIANRLKTLQYPYTWQHYLNLYHALEPSLYQNINTLEEFQGLIRTMGSTYEGDHVALSMLNQFYEVNVILLNSHETSFYCWGNEERYDDYIIIWYIDRVHYQIVGLEENNGKYYYWFTSQTIPKKLLKIWKYFCKKEEIINNSDIEEEYNDYDQEKNFQIQKKQMEEYRSRKSLEYYANKQEKNDFDKMVINILNQKERDRMFYPYQKGDILLFVNKPHQLQHRYHCRCNDHHNQWKCKRLDQIKKKLIYKNKKDFENYLQDPNEFYINIK